MIITYDDTDFNREIVNILYPFVKFVVVISSILSRTSSLFFILLTYSLIVLFNLFIFFFIEVSNFLLEQNEQDEKEDKKN